MDTTLCTLSARLTSWINRLMPETPRQAALVAALTEAFADRDEPVTAATCAEVEAVAQQHSRHLTLSYDPNGTASPDDHSPGWPPVDEEDVRRRAGAVTEVRRTADGAAVLRVDGLDALPLAQPYLEAAFALTGAADRIVLDLRGNGGGDPGTVALICGWLLGRSTHLSDVHYRDRSRQWWAPALPAEQCVPAHVPVDVLTSARTFSSGEALAYHLWARQRVRVVGEPSRGGSDHVTPIQLTPTVHGVLPEAYVVDAVTGGNWEATGVEPHLPCPADQALTVALATLP